MRTRVRSTGRIWPAILVVMVLGLFASPARAADVADGTITMKVDSGATKMCVIVPDDQLDPSCDALIASRISMMTEALAKQQRARVTFVGSLVGPDWVATVTLMRTSEHGEMSQSAIKSLSSQFGPDEAAKSSESRVNGLQVVRVENHLKDDGGDPEGYVLTHVLAGKTNYILTVAGPAAHQKELEAIAQGAVATVKLEPAEKTEVTTKETDSGFGGMAVKIGIGVLVAILVVLGGRVLLAKDEDLPPPGKGTKKKTKRHVRGTKKKREEDDEEDEEDDE